MLQCWIYDEHKRPKFNEILQKIEHFLLHPKTLTEKTELNDVSNPLLNDFLVPDEFEHVPDLDEWLNKINLGSYKRDLHAQGFCSLENLSNITARYMKDSSQPIFLFTCFFLVLARIMRNKNYVYKTQL